MRYHTPIKMAIIKKKKKCWQGRGEITLLMIEIQNGMAAVEIA